MVSASCSALALPTTVRVPFSLAERVWFVAVLVRLRVKSVYRVRSAISVTVGVGSTKSIVPLSDAVYGGLLKLQPVKSMRPEAGTGSPSEFVGEAGLLVGVQLADAAGITGAPDIGAAANGVPVELLNVAPSGSAAASVVTTSATLLASAWVRTALGDVDVVHAAKAATAMVPAANRQTLLGLRRIWMILSRVVADVNGARAHILERKTADDGPRSPCYATRRKRDAAHTPRRYRARRYP